MAAHTLGMVEMAASIREQRRQTKAAARRGGVFIDALTALQVDERREMTPAQIIARLAERAGKAAAARRRTPGLIRRRPMPVLQTVGDRDEAWTIGYLTDIILTRDPWMHRADIVRATGAVHVLTADHDGLLVADVVAEWAERHGQPYTLRLTGPAGGHWQRGTGGPEVDMDAVEFARTVSGRETADGLLAIQVPF
jgi:pimeloyl-ACP methyl ester carboxylesterase